MADLPFPQAAPGFDDPLGLLRACHMKMLQHAALLERLAAMDPADADFAVVRTRICRYFDESAPLHHEDEERDLFPALLRRDPALKTTVCTLNSQHPRLEAQWQSLRALLHEPPLPEDFEERAGSFLEALREHITLEETAVLQAADRLLDATDLERLGRAMARRRGVA